MPLINVSKELSDHFEKLKNLRDEVIDDMSETGSSKAAVMNALTGILKELAKIQKEVYNAELIAKLQGAIIEGLEDTDQKLKDLVVKNLDRKLEKL